MSGLSFATRSEQGTRAFALFTSTIDTGGHGVIAYLPLRSTGVSSPAETRSTAQSKAKAKAKPKPKQSQSKAKAIQTKAKPGQHRPAAGEAAEQVDAKAILS
ncbi:MAG: hypothetical protein KA223_08860 [Candidatus Accumulibacter sp.]|nr:hypothetical protein [Accumulibacter sp.]